MNMTNEIKELPKFTIEEFQSNFDDFIDRVEHGESFIITSENGNAVIVPHTEVVKVFEDVVDDELIRIHTQHEEGS
jgi:prevent-host-death family protein